MPTLPTSPDSATSADHHKIRQHLGDHAGRLKFVSITDLFAADPQRAQAMSVQACGLFFDYSKQRLDRDALAGLLEWSKVEDLAGKQRALFDGHPLNTSEQRPALHMMCRAPKDGGSLFGTLAQPFQGSFFAQRSRMLESAQQVRSGQRKSHSGKTLDQVIHVGIGGSDLGPVMVAQALEHLHDGPMVRFLSNVDGGALQATLNGLDARRLLLVVTSKTFTTQETLLNARAIIAWMVSEGAGSAQEILAHQVIGITANPPAAVEFGLPPDHILQFEASVGGRFSLWSAVGLPIAVAIGPDQFERLLAGAHAMDNHVLNAPAQSNLPLLMALIGSWNATFLALRSQAIVPYSQALQRLPAYLQQLEMESNGKSVQVDGSPAASTSPVIWGEPGTNGQHAFFQLLHQGTDVIPVDFIAIRQPHHPHADHQRWLLAHCLAQSRALMVGASASDPQQASSGNRPSSTLLMPQLDAYSLGALIAAYEHKVFYQAMLWGINPFDQWGVELGKVIARTIESVMRHADSEDALDPSTRRLLRWLETGQ